ncbi:beta-lactamase class A [Andreprevotia lacus DSM 23236]|jgi:beta-lactamase class A|uniref:Beta-lactamase n=1 Tax=Andreprevotia lacus DSM 23236 TaxID=1121001 RepID=A0A1W1XZV0_9NEIS|nr:class A beta-lactamase [Andreprevotia lacus]SMC29446.1 beta-lactamase class A [Andreprevotia lacus DSM 23236]
MTFALTRRTLLLTAAAVPLATVLASRALAATSQPQLATPAKAAAALAALEQQAGGRLGVYAWDTGSGAIVNHRADQRFPFCSTFKLMLAGAILARSAQQPALLTKRIHYRRAQLISHSPQTGQHLDDGMTVAELCAATLQYSDNAAANLLLAQLGGPAALTAFARSIGDRSFRLDRTEPTLNTAVPGDVRDTTTPAAMARSLHALTLGNALPAAQRQQLQDWLRGNTTGDKRIRAGVPAGWAVGDKTGSGAYGTTNDIAVLWPASSAPIVLAIYYTQDQPKADWRDAVLAQATRAVLQGA